MSLNLVDTFGFELINKIYDSQITKKEDVLILFVHWCIIKNGFKCIGLGDSKTHDPAEKGSELLPEGWNQQPNYTLRYVLNEKLYILLGTKSDADFLINLLRIEGHEASCVQFPFETTVNNLHGPLQALIPTYQKILRSVKRNLISPLYNNNTAEVSTQTHDPDEENMHGITDYYTVGPPQRPAATLPPWEPHGGVRGVGRSDLDPLAPGGGMLYDPFGSRSGGHPLGPGGLRGPGGTGGLGVPGSRLPPGSVPPGARFDPFGPPDILRPRLPLRQPDTDHLPPPGYDDMFM